MSLKLLLGFLYLDRSGLYLLTVECLNGFDCLFSYQTLYFHIIVLWTAKLLKKWLLLWPVT